MKRKHYFGRSSVGIHQQIAAEHGIMTSEPLCLISHGIEALQPIPNSKGM